MPNDFNIENIDESLLNSLNDNEKNYVLQILKEFEKEGKSDSFNNIIFDDYKEIPVDIETFLTDDNYLGKAWKDSTGKLKIYPFWMDRLKELFPNNIDTNYTTLLETGARGIGKSEIACGCVGTYLLYRVMCLKNPLEFYRLKPTEKICFAFMNIKKDLAEGIATEKFQKTLQMSPWFMSKGKITQRNNKPYWVPPEPINFIIGSQADDVIGLPIYFCLDGDTIIETSNGSKKIADLVNKEIKVVSIDNNGNKILSDVCTVKPTISTDEEYSIELEDGSIIKCTASHRFMLKDGSYKMAKDLTKEDELFDSDTKPFGYIYKFVNLKTNKLYIGKRECSHFDENYYGSGKLWKIDLKKFGKENIKREVLCYGYSREELNRLEKHYIKLYNAQNKDIGYNIHRGGQGGNSLNDTEEWSKIHSGERNGRYGKEVSVETRNKISLANKGKVRSQEFKECVSNRLKGVKKPLGFSNKISKAQKGRKRSDTELQHVKEGSKKAALKNKGKHIYNDRHIEKRFYEFDIIPENFKPGRLKRIIDSCKVKSNLPKNYKWFNNSFIEKFCEKCPDGYKKGRLKKNEN